MSSVEDGKIELISIFCFYNSSCGPQAFLSFSRKFKHCNIINFDGDFAYMVEFDMPGFKIRQIRNNEVFKVFDNLKSIKKIEAMVAVSIYERKAIPWWPLWGRTCNEVCRYGTGIDVGTTFNPIHLYKKLLKYDEKRNYKILSQWMR